MIVARVKRSQGFLWLGRARMGGQIKQETLQCSTGFRAELLAPRPTEQPPPGRICGSSNTPSQKSPSLFSGTPPLGPLLPQSHSWSCSVALLPTRLPRVHIPAPLFRVSLRRRLGLPIWSQDTNCTLCGQVMDKGGDHALVCGCGGDRVTRHNLVRDVVHSAANNGANLANLATILEKLGLLIPRDPIGDNRPPDPDPPDPSTTSRRPADVWVPRGPSGGQEAWDVSIASALRLGSSLPDASIFASVESRKNSFFNAAFQCTQAGVSFCPLVIEAVGGGWSDSLRSVVSWIDSESKRTHRWLRRQLQDRAAHLMHPSEGKRARDLEAGTRANNVSPSACQS